MQNQISQAELEAYHVLKQQRDEIDAECEARRRSILDRLEQGAEVEPGRLKANRRVSEMRRLTFPELRKLLGEQVVEELRQRLPGRKYDSLYVSFLKDEDRREPRAEAKNPSDEDEDDPGAW